MALPSIPRAMAHHIPRISVGRVPPTPTRLSMARTPGLAPSTAGLPGASSTLPRSPIASVPIASASTSARVPPTPAFASRAHVSATAYAQEKSAFLAPFETFFDALADAAQLKTWLAEQLARAQRLEEMVDRAVERRVGGAVRDEVGTLRRRVDELEGALRRAYQPPGSVQNAPSQPMYAHHLGPAYPAPQYGHAHTPTAPHPHAHAQAPHASPAPSSSSAGGAKGKAKTNGTPVHAHAHAHPHAHPQAHSHNSHSHAHSHAHSHSLPGAHPAPHIESYTFPPVGPPRDREREGEHESRSFPGSPIPGRRLSVSAIRLESRESQDESQAHGHAKRPSWEKQQHAHVRPELQRRVSGPPASIGSHARGDRERERERESGSGRREVSSPGMSVDNDDDEDEA